MGIFLTTPSGNCTYANNISCNNNHQSNVTTCGDNADCYSVHHKNLNLNYFETNYGVEPADYQVTFFGIKPCDAGGRTSIGSAYSAVGCPNNLPYWSESYKMRTIQHEISHGFGCQCGDLHTSSESCIMNGGYDNDPFAQADIWCDFCENNSQPYHFDRTAH